MLDHNKQLILEYECCLHPVNPNHIILNCIVKQNLDCDEDDDTDFEDFSQALVDTGCVVLQQGKTTINTITMEFSFTSFRNAIVPDSGMMINMWKETFSNSIEIQTIKGDDVRVRYITI